MTYSVLLLKISLIIKGKRARGSRALNDSASEGEGLGIFQLALLGAVAGGVIGHVQRQAVVRLQAGSALFNGADSVVDAGLGRRLNRCGLLNRRGFGLLDAHLVSNLAELAELGVTECLGGLNVLGGGCLRVGQALLFGVGAVSILIGIIYLILKLVFWDRFRAGMAPMLIGMFFLGAAQLVFIGLLGEYILSINARVLDRPLVVEEERINFEDNTPVNE